MRTHNHNRNDNGTTLSEINMIPLIDIMLVLLIIFMVTAPMLQEGISIDLPEVSAGSVDVSEKDFILSVDTNGQIYINDQKDNKFSVLSIEEKLKSVFSNRPDKVLYLRADKEINYGYVVEVMAACRRSGVEKIGMITHSPEDDEIANNKQPRN
ncbi:MAG: protein TolR [bacterium]|nr:protein TolR [bacterium]MBU1918643.1 protein TolR [bacterium]